MRYFFHLPRLHVFSMFVCQRYTWRPALVVVPLSTVLNWVAEFERWAPHLNVLSYVGSEEAREVMREHELLFDKRTNSDESEPSEASHLVKYRLYFS